MLYGGVGVSRGKSWSNGVEEYLGAQRTHCFLTRAGDFSLLQIGTIRPVCADWIPEASTSSLPLPIRSPRLSGSHCFPSSPQSTCQSSSPSLLPAHGRSWWRVKGVTAAGGGRHTPRAGPGETVSFMNLTRTRITFPENRTINGSSILECGLLLHCWVGVYGLARNRIPL